MKKIFLFLFMSFFMLHLQAQEWQYDFDQAKKQAAAENKKIILVFAGSDWCVPCIKLEREIFESEYFIQYAKEHYILVKADFPRKKKNRLSPEQQEKNNKLFEQYNPQGYFPLVVVFDSQGNLLGTLGYEKVSPEEYVEKINRL